MRYAMVIDLGRCMGCHSCVVGCKAEHNVPDDLNRSWVKTLGPSRTRQGIAFTFYPGHCNHCDEPACVNVCPAPLAEISYSDPVTGNEKKMVVAATWKDPVNGIVRIDGERCIGCGACVDACPYHARYMNTQTEKPRADKCSFCIERVEQGMEPVCVETCPCGARFFGDMEDPGSSVSRYIKMGARRLDSRVVNIGPNVYYLGSSKDISLLVSRCTPIRMPEVSARRSLLSLMVKPAIRKAEKLLNL
ncbi:MAG: 4Fe-4S dicluster domain-containing protein [Desulfobulbaceae bacterium]|nr:4Fe-4S dicluster domain-containing protein [Desulfobulbaceae bacterium]MCK5544388.1 4Fe-4S dicluster domain-containing protein [Desulfobulbaceae bacterium]